MVLQDPGKDFSFATVVLLVHDVVILQHLDRLCLDVHHGKLRIAQDRKVETFFGGV
jgi:hypothetical protein